METLGCCALGCVVSSSVGSASLGAFSLWVGTFLVFSGVQPSRLIFQFSYLTHIIFSSLFFFFFLVSFTGNFFVFTLCEKIFTASETFLLFSNPFHGLCFYCIFCILSLGIVIRGFLFALNFPFWHNLCFLHSAFFLWIWFLSFIFLRCLRSLVCAVLRVGL